MPLPEGFDSWEHLQSTLIKVQNKIVREEFNDVGGDDWDPDISTPRGELRVACTLLDNDTATMAKLRIDLFYLILRKASNFHPPIYGIPSLEFFDNFTHYPQIILYFSEDKYEAAIANRLPATAQVAVRWKEQTYTRTEIKALAIKIKQDFCTPVFKFKKGRELYTYTDKSSCEDDLSVRRDINHLKNHLSQQSLNLGAIESELEGAINGLDQRLDRLEILVTEIKVKLQG